MRSVIAIATGVGLLLAASVAQARPTEEQIAKLGGPEFTPMGAQRAGNEDGTIPDFETPNWEILNTFRTQVQIEGGAIVDIVQ